jgi:integrase
MSRELKNIEQNSPVSAPNQQNSQKVGFKRRMAPEPSKYLSPDQLQDLFRVIDSKRDEAMFRIIYCKGLRASEVGRLELSDWDDHERMLYIHRLKGSRSAAFHARCRTARAARLAEDSRARAGPAISLAQPSAHLAIPHLGTHGAVLPGGEDPRAPRASPHPQAQPRAASARRDGRIHVVQDALGNKNIASTMIYAEVSNRDRRQAVALNRTKY